MQVTNDNSFLTKLNHELSGLERNLKDILEKLKATNALMKEPKINKQS